MKKQLCEHKVVKNISSNKINSDGNSILSVCQQCFKYRYVFKKNNGSVESSIWYTPNKILLKTILNSKHNGTK